EEFSAAGLPVGSVLPATLMLRPADSAAVVSALRREFAHPGIEFYLSALRGIVYWAAHQKADRGGKPLLPRLPADLVREVGTAVAMRRPDALRLSMDGALAVLGYLGGRADARFRSNLIVGLDYLTTEASYQERAGSTRTIRYEEVPAIRTYAVKLANRLSEIGHGSDPVVRRW